MLEQNSSKSIPEYDLTLLLAQVLDDELDHFKTPNESRRTKATFVKAAANYGAKLLNLTESCRQNIPVLLDL